MWRLLQIELHKIRYNTASKVLIIVYFGLLASIALLAALKIDVGPIQFSVANQGIFNFPYIWHFSTWLASGFKFFLLLVIVSMMANEYSNRTLKQNLIDGLSKKEFVLSKFLTVVLFAVLSTVFVAIMALILGFIYSDNLELALITRDLVYLMAYFIKLVGFFSFGLFLGVLIKRSAFAVGAMIVWYIGEVIVVKFLEFKYMKENFETVTQFFPLESISNLIKEPFSKIKEVKTVAQQIGEEISKDYSVQSTDILIVLLWTVLFVFGSYYLLKKRDL